MAIRPISFNVVLKSSARFNQKEIPIAYTGDLNTVELQFTLTDTTALELVGATVKMYLYTRSKVPYQGIATITDNVVSYVLTEAEGSHAGITHVEFEVIFADGSILASPSLFISVQHSLNNEVFAEPFAYDLQAIKQEAEAELIIMRAQEVSRLANEGVRETNEDVREQAEIDRTAQYVANHTTASGDHNVAVTDHVVAVADHGVATTDHTTASADHTQALADSGVASVDHTRADGDHTVAVADHNTANSDHNQAVLDSAKEVTRQTTFVTNEGDRQATFEGSEEARTTIFNQSETSRTDTFSQSESDRTNTFDSAEQDRHIGYTTDHSRAESDHSIATTDHNTATTDHTTASGDHTIALADHSTASSDHTTALADHAIVGGYNGRLTTIETVKANKAQEEWITPTLLNGFVSEYSTVYFKKDEFGRIQLKGRLAVNTANLVIFILPKGYRPPLELTFACYQHADKVTRISVYPTGEVKLMNQITGFFTLDNITFLI